jgi:predicted RNA binding protein YcfA (HicA-like mRNA interferase family)
MLVRVTEREVVRLIVRDGWFFHHASGSHHIYHHPVKPGRVIVAHHARGRDVPVGTLYAILKQAGLR